MIDNYTLKNVGTLTFFYLSSHKPKLNNKGNLDEIAKSKE